MKNGQIFLQMFVIFNLINFLFQFDQFVEFDSFLVEKWGTLDRRVARNFLGQGRVPQIRAQTFGSSESQSYM